MQKNEQELRRERRKQFNQESARRSRLKKQKTTVEEANKFYPLFGLGANIALIFSGRTVKYFSQMRQNLGPGVDGWALSLKGLMSIVVMMGLSICFIYWWVNNNVTLPAHSMKKKIVSVNSGQKRLKDLVMAATSFW